MNRSLRICGIHVKGDTSFVKECFYDIESLDNVFTLANFRAHDNVVEVYYLVDDPQNLDGRMVLPPDDPDRPPPVVRSENPLCVEPACVDVAVGTPLFFRLCARHIRESNKNFTGMVEFYDLRDPESNFRLARTFGLSDARQINNPSNPSSYPDEFRLRCDTDPDYDEEEDPYLLGYNSRNYDTTMLAMYLYDAISAMPGTKIKSSDPPDPSIFTGAVTAACMRQYNNELFEAEFKDRMPDRLLYEIIRRPNGKPYKKRLDRFNPLMRIRKNMLMSGRHIDVSNLNEKQSKVGLKRLLGMIGCQIMESSKLKPNQSRITTVEELLELFAYNVSDVVNLNTLFDHKVYRSGFQLKKQLLKDYPELVYDRDENIKDADGNVKYAPCVDQRHVRNDRLFIDSSSAQLATKSLCPYDHLSDYDTVSFMYPSEAKAKALGIPRVNVLEETRKFFYANFPQPELRAEFDKIYTYYKWIEGKNFNASKNYLADHGADMDSDDPSSFLPEELKVAKFFDAPDVGHTCLPYYNADGTPSTCFVNFSIGGIHGAELNRELYEFDVARYRDVVLPEYKRKTALLDKVKSMFPDPRDLKREKGVVVDGVRYPAGTFLVPKSTEDSAAYRTIDRPDPPVLFSSERSERTGALAGKLNNRYAYTSADMTNHEDFTSYYPNMLRMMDAFFNPGLGYDRYGEIFDQKTEFGHKMKDKSLPEETRELYSVMRNGTKLILNSASGAADATFESNIRMNNKIISMRIIGQLFTYRIGQAQTIAGAKITSTNTDGLYSVMEATRNNEILARESESIHVEIEPEPIYLISKDSNNRAEIKAKDNQLCEIVGASGGSLSCRKGPTPSQALAHPAILDWALAEYLVVAASGGEKWADVRMDAPFNEELGMRILMSAREQFNDDVHALLMFQNVVASSPGSIRYVFAYTDDDYEAAIPLQHYNRAFIMTDKLPGTVHMQAALARVVADNIRAKRARNGERLQQHESRAIEILAVNGVKLSSLPENKEAVVVKIPNLEDSWSMLIDNSNLFLMPKERIDFILDNLDYGKYLGLLKDAFVKNWYNESPRAILAREAAERAEQARKQAEKDAEKAAKQAEKEAERARKQAEREAEKARKQAEREAAKAARAAEKAEKAVAKNAKNAKNAKRTKTSAASTAPVADPAPESGNPEPGDNAPAEPVPSSPDTSAEPTAIGSDPVETDGVDAVAPDPAEDAGPDPIDMSGNDRSPESGMPETPEGTPEEKPEKGSDGDALAPEEQEALGELMVNLSKPEPAPEIDPDADLAADLNLPKPLPRRSLVLSRDMKLDEESFRQAEAVLLRYGVRKADLTGAVNTIFKRMFGDGFIVN